MQMLMIENKNLTLIHDYPCHSRLAYPKNVQKKFKNSLTEHLAFWDSAPTHGNN